ncbi:hypothetical protein BH10PSE4_BH10PSE4_40090 [soil metagenome]
MDAQDLLLQHRTPMIGAAVALALGLTGGLMLKTGSQAAPYAEPLPTRDSQYAEAEPIVWPTGKVPDYVIGTDFLIARQPVQPPVAVASYGIPDYTPANWDYVPANRAEAAASLEPKPEHAAEPYDRAWPSTQGDILAVRLPEDAPAAPEAPEAPEAPVAITAPMAIAASN